METSPPAWGKPRTDYARSLDRGKHPHLRGENRKTNNGRVLIVETSPPAWGKLPLRPIDNLRDRNIPTCVGKTLRSQERSRQYRKHPHLRGENDLESVGIASRLETSPPAWGKLPPAFTSPVCPRNIPTCVGKTARFCLDCHSGYYILLKSKFLALSLRQGRAIFAYHPSLGIDLRLAEAQRDVPNDCGGRVIKGRLLPN